MTRILTLLNQKNHYLEKFYALNESEFQKFLHGNFDQIESFYQTRERILEMIKYIDAEIDKTQDTVVDSEAPQFSIMKRRISEALRTKNVYVEKIIQQDLEILSCIESAKNSIIKDLQDLHRGKKAVGGYKIKTYSNKIDEEI